MRAVSQSMMVVGWLIPTLWIGSVGPGRAAAGSPPAHPALQGARCFQIETQPYRVYSDAPRAEVDELLGLLGCLRQDFEIHFRGLLIPSAQPTAIEVLYFAQADDLSRYAERVAPALADSAGFFCSQNNRLVLASPRTVVERPLAQRPQPGPGNLSGQVLPAVRSLPLRQAREMTARVARHEGAHQLFTQYGLHSRFALEPTWITEGLAEYCVPAPIGSLHGVYARRLATWQQRGRLLSLEALLNQRDPHGFFALDDATTEIAYAQSWALVYFLMHSRHRDGFLGLLRFYRDTQAAEARAVEDTEPRRLLLQHLGLDEAGLANEWEQFLGGLTASAAVTAAGSAD